MAILNGFALNKSNVSNAWPSILGFLNNTHGNVLAPPNVTEAIETCFRQVEANTSNAKFTLNGLQPTIGYSLFCATDLTSGIVSQRADLTTADLPFIYFVAGYITQVNSGARDCPTSTTWSNGTQVNLTINGQSRQGVGVSATSEFSLPEVMVGAQKCPVFVSNQTSIECLLPQGQGEDVSVSVLNINAFLLLLGVSYADPHITTIVSADCTTNGSEVTNCGRVSGVITIQGTNFGRCTATVLIAGQHCLDVKHKPPGCARM